jgi:hypothetical protein
MTERALATSPDGQWVIARHGRVVAVLAGGLAPPIGRFELDVDAAELALVGPPSAAVAIAGRRVSVHELPSGTAVAGLELEAPAKLAAITGPRIALCRGDGHVTIVREAGRAIAHQLIDLGAPIELAVGLDKNQILFGTLRKLEVWDAVSGRPLRKLSLPIPPPPCAVGAAAGHLWASRPGGEELLVFRMSDGRPFRHLAGAPIEQVICHPASPLIVLVTPRGLIRLSCFAHSLSIIDNAPWAPGQPLAQLVVGDDISLLGLAEGAVEPWRVAIGGAGAPVGIADDASAAPPPLVTAADKLRAMRAAYGAAPAPSMPSPTPTTTRSWRDAVAAYGEALLHGTAAELPDIAGDTELSKIVHLLEIRSDARKALIALYGLYLAGEPAIGIARLARALADWTEALGKGELAQLALIHRARGRVALRTAVGDACDGAPPRAIRLVGTSDGKSPRAGMFRVARDGRTDAALVAELAQVCGRVAVAMGPPTTAVLEARLHGATAVALVAPAMPPRPWPRGASLVIVTGGAPSAWLADVPALA